ncbi:hypothetical protein QZH41_019810, partial [Actinostola sp. cb2023]
MDNEDSSDGEGNNDIEDHTKRNSAAYLLRIKETYNLTKKAVNDVIDNTTNILREAVVTVCEKITNEMKSITGEDYSAQIGWGALFDETSSVANPFWGMGTAVGQTATFRELFGLFEPEKRVLGFHHGHRRKGAKRRRVQLPDEVIDIPFLSSLKQMLNDPSILRQVEIPHQRNDELIEDFCDGFVFSQHPLFSRDPQALQIILYYDEVEVVNPLGSKTSKHKVGVFYYTLGNIHPIHRSQLKCIRLLAIAKRPVIKEYGTNTILENFMDDLTVGT